MIANHLFKSIPKSIFGRSLADFIPNESVVGQIVHSQPNKIEPFGKETKKSNPPPFKLTKLIEPQPSNSYYSYFGKLAIDT